MRNTRCSNNGASTQRNTGDSGPKSRHIAEKVAAAMSFNMVVLSEYEDESMMGAVTNPLSTWKRDLPKGLNSQGERQSYFVIRCHGVVSFRQIDTRRDSGLERFAAIGL